MFHLRRFGLWCFVITIVFAGDSTVIAMEEHGDATLPVNDLADALMNGLRSGRERLRAGVFHAAGELLSEGKGEPSLQGDFTVFSAFDDDSGDRRFDQTCPIRLTANDTSVGWRQVLMETRWARSRGAVSYWNSLQSASVAIISGTSPPMSQCAFDVRIVGMGSIPDLKSDVPFQEVYDRFAKLFDIVSVAEEANDVYHMEFVQKNAPMRCGLWIDRSKGYVPVRMEYGYLGKSPLNDNGPPVVVANEADWTEVNTVFVPTRWKLSSRSTDGCHDIYNLRFTWDAVNTPPVKELFTAQGLKVPHPSVIIDERLSKPVVVGLTGSSSPLPNGGEAASGRPPVRHNRSNIATFAWIAIPLLLVIFIIVLRYVRRK